MTKRTVRGGHCRSDGDCIDDEGVDRDVDRAAAEADPAQLFAIEEGDDEAVAAASELRWGEKGCVMTGYSLKSSQGGY